MGRIIDLSHKMIPGKEEYRLELKTFNTEEIVPNIKRRKDVWYILQEIYMSSHVGTHIEFPYHHIKNGQDAGDFPLEKLIGEGIVLDFSGKKDNEAITLADLKGYEKLIKKKDIVFIRTDRDKFFRTKSAHNRPYVTTEGINWLIRKGINCLGTDATGVELKGTDYQPNHAALFSKGVPLIESMTNLSKLRKKRFKIFILPLAICGMDSCPVRIIGME